MVGTEAPAAGRSVEEAARALKEEEARLLHLEVSSRSLRCSDFEGLELSFLSPCSQGGADRPRPCTH
jgi:hypothetical protein